MQAGLAVREGLQGLSASLCCRQLQAAAMRGLCNFRCSCVNLCRSAEAAPAAVIPGSSAAGGRCILLYSLQQWQP